MSFMKVMARPRPFHNQKWRERPGFEDGKGAQQRKSVDAEPSTNVFVSYIPAEFTEVDLRNLCSPFGGILTSKIMVNLETGQSKCFGFVRFETLGQAEAAITGLNGKEVGTKRLLVKYAASRERRERTSATVYVKRLPISIDVEQVREIFGGFGKVVEMSRHVIDSTESDSWRCVVRFSCPEEATRTISSLNNIVIAAGTRPIHVRFADESRMSQGPMFAATEERVPLGTHSRSCYGGPMGGLHIELVPQRQSTLALERQHSAGIFKPLVDSDDEDDEEKPPLQLLPSFLLDE